LVQNGNISAGQPVSGILPALSPERRRALILMRRQKLCSVLSNLLCVAAAALGGAGALAKILSGSGRLDIARWESAVPFLSVNIKMDNLSAIFLFFLSVLALCVSIYSIGYLSRYIGERNVGLFCFLYPLFLLSIIMIFTSANVVFFYFSWEAMSILSYFLVVFESEQEENRRAGILYIIMTHMAAPFCSWGL
jgi:formate hydrogenlyase subunit 3/multisubunit Na+/H+ antiporter MnhD subunit